MFGHRDTHVGRTFYGDGAEIQGMILQSQGMPQITSNHQTLEERHGTDSPSQFSEGSHPVDTLIGDF